MPLIISSIIKGLQPHDESSKTSPWASGWHSQSNGREKHKPVERAGRQMMGSCGSLGKKVMELMNRIPELSSQLCHLLIREPRTSHLWNGHRCTIWQSCEDHTNGSLLVKCKVLGESNQWLWSTGKHGRCPETAGRGDQGSSWGPASACPWTRCFLRPLLHYSEANGPRLSLQFWIYP